MFFSQVAESYMRSMPMVSTNREHTKKHLCVKVTLHICFIWRIPPQAS